MWNELIDHLGDILLAILGPTGIAGILAILNHGSAPVSRSDLRQVEANRAVEDSGIAEEYRSLYREMSSRVERLQNRADEDHIRIATLETEQAHLRERNSHLELRDIVHAAFEDTLIAHINNRLPPPAPDRPALIDPKSKNIHA